MLLLSCFITFVYCSVCVLCTVSVPTGVLSYNNVNAVNDYASSWGGEDGVVYFGQTFTNLHTLEMFSYYITPDISLNTYDKIYTSETYKSVVLEWSTSNFGPTNTVWKGSATLGTQAGYSANTFSVDIEHDSFTFHKVTANLGSAITLSPTKTYMLAFYFLASVDADVYALASVASGSGQAYSMQTAIPPSLSSSWDHWTNEGTFVYEIVIGDCNAAPCLNGGTCVGPNNCSCASGFSGSTCATPVCSVSCKNSGSCVAPNTCSCVTGWQGTDCSQPVCTVPCNNGGVCSTPNVCSCASGWDGVASGCNTPICTNACAHGTCTGPNTCTCENNWQGAGCNVTGCDNLTTCGGHGECTAGGSCNCSIGFDNSTNCASCSAEYFDYPYCYSVALLPSPPIILDSIGGLFNVTIQWEAASPSTDTNYTLEWNFKNTWEVIYQGPLVNEFVLRPLYPNSTYLFRISAFNEYGISTYVYFNKSTLEAGMPGAPLDLACSEYSRSTMDISWDIPTTDGGLPILGYYVRMSNLSSQYTWTVTSPEYTVEGLMPATSYLFSIAAFNLIGSSDYSTPNTFQTAPIICGDGICDANEDCVTCFFDCGACGYGTCRGNPECSGQGTCSKGLCNCEGSWYGDACQYQEVLPITVTHSNSVPSVDINFNNATQNASISFGIVFTTIQELDSLGDIVSRYNLEVQPTTLSTSQNSNGTTYEYRIALPNQANITIDATWYNVSTNIEFANENMQVPQNGLKYLLRVDNWPFVGLTHRLVLSMRTNTSAQGPRVNAGPCAAPPDKTPSVNTNSDVDSNNLRSIFVNMNGVTLYGKFMENAYFDGAYNVHAVQFSFDNSTSSVDIAIPHFWNFVALDPNFEVLLDPYSSESSDECAEHTYSKRNNLTGKIVGGVIGAVAGIAIIAGAVYYFHLRRKWRASMSKLQFTEGSLS